MLDASCNALLALCLRPLTNLLLRFVMNQRLRKPRASLVPIASKRVGIEVSSGDLDVFETYRIPRPPFDCNDESLMTCRQLDPKLRWTMGKLTLETSDFT